jgi:feruloyl esterase
VNGSKWLTAAQWGLVHNEIMNQCDALDGVVDGIIGDPRRCSFNPETLACTGASTQNCLTDAQVGAVKGVYTPWKLDNGTGE